MSKIYAPWTPAQVHALNTYQQSGVMHPFTCGHCRDTLGCNFYEKEDGSLERVPDEWDFAERQALYREGKLIWLERELVATANGWECSTCDYTQDWAHAFMADLSAINDQIRLGWLNVLNQAEPLSDL